VIDEMSAVPLPTSWHLQFESSSAGSGGDSFDEGIYRPETGQVPTTRKKNIDNGHGVRLRLCVFVALMVSRVFLCI
jgi:hypothetical protein